MKNFNGKILFLDRSDINTDEIIPAKYLTELTKAALNAPTKQAKADCFLYLGLCYLKTGRKEYAKAAAIEASWQVRTIYQKENLKKLMKLVEKAYGYGV